MPNINNFPKHKLFALEGGIIKLSTMFTASIAILTGLMCIPGSEVLANEEINYAPLVVLMCFICFSSTTLIALSIKQALYLNKLHENTIDKIMIGCASVLFFGITMLVGSTMSLWVLLKCSTFTLILFDVGHITHTYTQQHNTPPQV